MRWLGVLARHYAAAAFAVPTSTTFDAIRLLVMAALVGFLDAVLRLPATNAPALLPLHYAGRADGAPANSQGGLGRHGHQNASDRFSCVGSASVGCVCMLETAPPPKPPLSLHVIFF